jgi:hypothetical protein
MANELQQLLFGLAPSGSGTTALMSFGYVEPPDVPVGMTLAEYRRRRPASTSARRRLSAGLRAGLAKLTSDLI